MFKLDWVGVESSPMCNCSSKYRVVWLEGVTRLQHGDEELGTSLSFPHLDCSYNTASVSVHAHPYHPLFFFLHPYLILFHTVLKKFETKIEHPAHIAKADEEFQLGVCGKWVRDTIVISAPWLHCHLQISHKNEVVFHLSVWPFCITLCLGETDHSDHSLEWAPPHSWSLAVMLKDTKAAGYSRWGGMQNDFKGWAKVPSKQGTKQSSLGSTCPDEDGRCPISIILLTVSRLFPGECFSLLT